MISNFKATLSFVHKLMWTIITVSITLLLIDPNEATTTILGITVVRSILTIVGPLLILGLILARLIAIRNAADIVRLTTHTKELKEIVSTYPLSEFMRWRLVSSLETFLLTIFQAGFDALPSIAVYLFLRRDISENDLIVWIFSFLIIFFSARNYSLLRRSVYEPLLGPIGTPD